MNFGKDFELSTSKENANSTELHQKRLSRTNSKQLSVTKTLEINS